MNETVVKPIGSVIATIYSMNEAVIRNVNANLIRRDYNPCNDVIVTCEAIPGMLGPMYDGNKMEIDGVTYKVHDRFESAELYDCLSR